MPPAPFADRLPDAVRRLRILVRVAILWLAWLAVPLPGWLAARGGMGWELVSAMGLGVAVAASLGARNPLPGRRGRLLLGLALTAACLLVLGAGRGTLPAPVASALSLLVLVLVGGFCDRRVVLAVSAALVAACVLPMLAGGAAMAGQAAALVCAVPAVMLLQRGLRNSTGARGRVVVLPPAMPAASGWTLPPAATRPAGFLVQAERAPDGTLRLALAGHDPGRLRVTVS